MYYTYLLIENIGIKKGSTFFHTSFQFLKQSVETQFCIHHLLYFFFSARSEGEAHLPFVVFVDVAADITFILYGCDHFRNAWVGQTYIFADHFVSPSFRQQSNMASLIVISCTSAKVFSNWYKALYISFIAQIDSIFLYVVDGYKDI